MRGLSSSAWDCHSRPHGHARHDLASQQLHGLRVAGVDLHDEVLRADVDQRLVIRSDLPGCTRHEGTWLRASRGWRAGPRLPDGGDFLRDGTLVRSQDQTQGKVRAQDLVVGASKLFAVATYHVELVLDQLRTTDA